MMEMTKVACVGDSITWGYSIIGRSRYSYPAVLQQLLGEGYEVKNFGFNDASARLDADTPYVTKEVYGQSHEFQPDIVVIMLGSNDTKRRNWDPEKYRHGYTTIIDSYLALDSHPKIYLMTPPHIYNVLGINIYSLFEETVANGVIPVVQSMAAERGFQVIDVHSLLDRKSLFNDGVHPGREGARMIAELVASAIRQWND